MDFDEIGTLSQEDYQARMRVRMDVSKFDIQRLANYMLTQHWMHECQIIPDYMPPFPNAYTRPTCQVMYKYRRTGHQTFLRHGGGPLAGGFWDLYGTDFGTPELALIALSQAPAPGRISVIPTHGTGNYSTGPRNEAFFVSDNNGKVIGTSRINSALGWPTIEAAVAWANKNCDLFEIINDYGKVVAALTKGKAE